MLSDPKILDRAASVTESYDTFINAAQTYGSGNRWEQALEGVDGAMWDLYELKRLLYRAVANVNILEGIGSMSRSAARLLLVNSNYGRISKNYLSYRKR